MLDSVSTTGILSSRTGARMDNLKRSIRPFHNAGVSLLLALSLSLTPFPAASHAALAEEAPAASAETASREEPSAVTPPTPVGGAAEARGCRPSFAYGDLGELRGER